MNQNTVIENEYMEKFLNLAVGLSPENISWDGERSYEEIKKAESEILKEWKKLEKEYNVSLTVDDVYDWHSSQIKRHKPSF